MEWVLLVIFVFGISSSGEDKPVEELEVLAQPKASVAESSPEPIVHSKTDKTYIDTERGYLYKNLTTNQNEEQ